MFYFIEDIETISWQFEYEYVPWLALHILIWPTLRKQPCISTSELRGAEFLTSLNLARTINLCDYAVFDSMGIWICTKGAPEKTGNLQVKTLAAGVLHDLTNKAF